MSSLQRKHSMSASPSCTADDVTCSGRGVPFPRGGFQPIVFASQFQGQLTGVSKSGKGKNDKR